VQFEYPPRARIEWVIAGARVVLAVGGLFAIWIDPTTSVKPGTLSFALLIVYTVHSLGILALVQSPVKFGWGWGLTAHAFDLVAFSVFIFLAPGASSPFFIYFVFSVICGALRWDARGALLTAAAALALWLGMAGVQLVRHPDFELGPFITRTVPFMLVGILIAYLSSYHPRNLREMLRFASWPHGMPRDERDVVTEIVERAHNILPAPRILLIWQGPEDEFLNVVCRGDRGLEWLREPAISYTPLAIPSLDGLSFQARDVTDPDGHVDFWSSGQFRHANRVPINQALITQFGMREVQSSALDGDVVHGRLFWLDRRRMRIDDLVVGDLVARLSASRLDCAYLLTQFREAAALDERVRVARDLHDSLLQTLTAAGLQLAVARRVFGSDPEMARAGLDEVQEQLEQTELDIRSLIRRLRPLPREAKVLSHVRLDERLEAVRQRVQRQWRVDVTLDMPASFERMSGELNEQIYLIVQEAVLNAARHANASTIQVILESDDDRVSVQVQDDGKGFPFVGSYDLAALNKLDNAPLTLRERVTELGGDLHILSGASGAHLRITLPLGHASVS
jgi:signal transduction histidine kinase